MGGLAAALALRRVPKITSVDIFEKSAGRLTDGGAGIVLQPEVEEALRRFTTPDEKNNGRGVEVHLTHRKFVERDGAFTSRRMPQPMTSWEAVWKRLRNAVRDESHHAGVKVNGVKELEDGRVKLIMNDDGATDALSETAYDLVVAADGAGSAIRQQLLPNTEPSYAGYVAYRGTLSVSESPDDVADFFKGSFSMYSYPNSRQHILVYLIPGLGGTTDPSKQRINWVWYRNKRFEDAMKDKEGRLQKYSVPAGYLSSEDEAKVTEDAKRLLPPQFAELVASTERPYVQAIHDMSVERMVLGDNSRVALIGDAAALVRPHTASGTSKAVGDAMDLADLLTSSDDKSPTSGAGNLTTVLKVWEKHRLGRIKSLEAQGRMMGDRYGPEEPEA